jgi:elongation factor Ts
MITAEEVKKLRDITGASMMDCKRALEETGGNTAKAVEILRKKSLIKAEKKSERETNRGIVEAYVHSNQRVGAMAEILCETDFVARNEIFRQLAHDLVMHIAAMSPLYLDESGIPAEIMESEKRIFQEQVDGNLNKPARVINEIIEGKMKKHFQEICLMSQPFIKNPDITIEELIKEHIAKLGENIKIGRFARFEL